MPNPNTNFDIPKVNLATSWADALQQIRRPAPPEVHLVPPTQGTGSNG